MLRHPVGAAATVDSLSPDAAASSLPDP
jgi:hypothetical protein